VRAGHRRGESACAAAQDEQVDLLIPVAGAQAVVGRVMVRG
jgi:hypothetical protein